MRVITSWKSTTPGTALVFLLPFTLLLGACGVLPGTNGHYTFDPAPVEDSYDCLANAMLSNGPDPSNPALTKGSVPEGFVPVEAVECSLDFGSLSPTSGPVRQRIREDHLSGDLAPLLAALAEPSDRGGDWPCTADMQIVPDLWLVDAAGKAIHVYWPLDGCNKTKPGTSQALAALNLRETLFLDGPIQEQEPQPPKVVMTEPAAPTAAVPQPGAPQPSLPQLPGPQPSTAAP